MIHKISEYQPVPTGVVRNVTDFLQSLRRLSEDDDPVKAGRLAAKRTIDIVQAERDDKK